ncbi:MAG: TPM domain-containing protein [Nanoarchaeota archaeon]|nr:TPM domain-containing protein [Nanoarchaeota archaeon]
MRKWLFIFFITLAFVLPLSAYALDVPKSKGYVSDYAGMLNAEQVSSLEKKLREFEKLTSNEIAILIIQSLKGENLEEFSLKVASTWGVGKRSKDNGILVFIAKDDHKIRIEVGYGLEGVVPDGAAGYIIRKYMTPQFKEEHFYKGINDAVDSLMKATNKEYAEEFKKEMEKEELVKLVLLLTVIGAILTLVTAFIHWTLSGTFCGGGAMFTYGLLFNLNPVWWVILFIAGFLFGALLSKFIEEADISPGDIGGIFLGGGDGGGGGGFGGGGFGGGGASGGW